MVEVEVKAETKVEVEVEVEKVVIFVLEFSDIPVGGSLCRMRKF